MIGSGVVIDNGCTIESSVRIFHNSVIRENVKLLSGVVIGHLCVIERDTLICTGTTIQSQCHITAEAVIGPDCFFGPGVIMTNEKNIANKGRTEAKIETTMIGKGVRIGAGCLILPGVNIGDNAFIAAGSLVSKNVPKGEMWAGRPARKVRDVPREEWL
ncbi:MAG: hypothetical protein OEL55_02975 [Desulfobulbaceae bacterium]|nr:hypothetical protein [Desulfobulbaceae bacterium]